MRTFKAYSVSVISILFAICSTSSTPLEDISRTSRKYPNERKLSVISGSSSTPENRTRISETTHTNEYGEFKLIQSNVIRINTPAYKYQRRNLFKREISDELNSAATAPLALPVPSTPVPTPTTLISFDERANQEARHKDKKKKKKKNKKGGHSHLMHKLKKWMPGFVKKMHGPSMFMLGMMQANFNNFVMHAFMMSKMALLSVFIMIIREIVFGDKDQPVKYYNFGYEHQAHHYEPPPPPPPYPIDDYQYSDYTRRRKRNVS